MSDAAKGGDIGTMRISVIGAGIIGSAIAYHLARCGARVLLIDELGIGGLTSPCSFGWTNATFGNPKPYYDLRCRAMREWDVLKENAADIPFQQSGCLYLDSDRIDLPAFFEQHRSWGYDLEWVSDAQISELEPNLTRRVDLGLFAPKEGAVEAEGAARCFAQMLVAQGGQTVRTARVENLLYAGEKIGGIVLDGEAIASDLVVLAAGVATAQLAKMAGVHIPLEASPGLLIHTKPISPRLSHVVLAPGLHFRQQANGALLAGADFGGGEVSDEPEVNSRDLLARLESELATDDNLELDRYTLGVRPIPGDGLPIVGHPVGVNGLYLAVTHSGATLAPLIGRYVAEEILEGDRNPLLMPFGPSRFHTPLAGIRKSSIENPLNGQEQGEPQQ
ncbi:MAG: NAD(P)/FAD-dependent oxidoreductase [Hyphomicrobiaceae bacterium]